jgi:hypothetical protein
MNENIQAYVILIQKGKMTIDQVPEELREEVKQQLGTSE